MQTDTFQSKNSLRLLIFLQPLKLYTNPALWRRERGGFKFRKEKKTPTTEKKREKVLTKKRNFS